MRVFSGGGRSGLAGRDLHLLHIIIPALTRNAQLAQQLPRL